jgi:hypothetical protein
MAEHILAGNFDYRVMVATEMMRIPAFAFADCRFRVEIWLN